MSSTIGYVVIEYNQASHQPELLPHSGLYYDRENAEQQANDERDSTAATGRHERYAVAAVEVLDDEDQADADEDANRRARAKKRLDVERGGW